MNIVAHPNTIAYGTGEVRNRDMMLSGAIIGVTATAVVLLTGPFV